jgi:molybdenum cofactor cytidylyltransferase
VGLTGPVPGTSIQTSAAVVLAAGAGTRFVGPDHKLRTSVAGRPLVRHAVDGALEAGFVDLIVVTGAVDLGDVLPDGVVVVHHDDWADGIATSLHVGIRVAGHLGHDAVVVGLGDQVGVGAACWRAVGVATDSPIAVATFDGERRPPVRLRSDVWNLLPPSGDEGARVLMRRHPELVHEVPCDPGAADIDTVDDLPLEP